MPSRDASGGSSETPVVRFSRLPSFRCRWRDGHEDELYGEARGDELPAEIATRAGRRGWLRDALRQLDEQRSQEARPIPGPRPERLKEAKRRREEELVVERRANAAYEHHRTFGRDSKGRRMGARSKLYTPPATPQGTINTTDPDSRLQKVTQGWIQGYNAQAAVNERHVILAADVMVASPDFGHLEPMLSATRAELAQAGVRGQPEVVVADAGYWHQEQMERVMADGVTVLVTPDGGLREAARLGRRALRVHARRDCQRARWRALQVQAKADCDCREGGAPGGRATRGG